MKRIVMMMAAAMMSVAMCTTFAFASISDTARATKPQSHTGDHGTVYKARVSEDVDTALNSDARMGTSFNLYLAPDIPEVNPLKDTPKMGDSGYKQSDLLKVLLIAGGCYLVSDGVANACKGKKRDAVASTLPV